MVTTTTAKGQLLLSKIKGQLLQSLVNYHSQRLGSSSAVGDISFFFLFIHVHLFITHSCVIKIKFLSKMDIHVVENKLFIYGKSQTEIKDVWFSKDIPLLEKQSTRNQCSCTELLLHKHHSFRYISQLPSLFSHSTGHSHASYSPLVSSNLLVTGKCALPWTLIPPRIWSTICCSHTRTFNICNCVISHMTTSIFTLLIISLTIHYYYLTVTPH
jgi:hypothetical protein